MRERRPAKVLIPSLRALVLVAYRHDAGRCGWDMGFLATHRLVTTPPRYPRSGFRLHATGCLISASTQVYHFILFVALDVRG